MPQPITHPIMGLEWEKSQQRCNDEPSKLITTLTTAGTGAETEGQQW